MDRSRGPRRPQGPARGALLLAALLCCAGGAAAARAEGEPAAPSVTETAGPAPATATAAPPRSSAPPAPAPTTASAEAARLAPLLRSEDTAVRERAAEALLVLGDAAVPALELEAARAEAPLSRIRALIGLLRPTPPPAAPGARAGGRPSPGQVGLSTGASAGGPWASPWWQEKVADAKRRMDRGDHLGAVKLLDAILVLEPDCPDRDVIQALRIRAKELQLRRTLLEAKIVPKRVLLAPGEPIELSLELKNVSSEDLELSSEDGESGLEGRLEIETFEASGSGERSRVRDPQTISMLVPAKLKPAETWKTPLTLRPQKSPPPGVFRRIAISGAIRLRTLARKDEQVNSFLPLFAVEVVVVEKAWHALAADPLRTLQEEMAALREAKDLKVRAAHEERAFYASMLVPYGEHDKALVILASALERENDPGALSAMTNLALLSDRPLGGDRLEWLAWVHMRMR